MTQPGPSQGESPEADQEFLWDEQGGDVEVVAPGAQDGALGVDAWQVAPPPRRSPRGVSAASGWTRSLTSTAAQPGPAGLVLADVPNRVIALVLDVIVLAIVGLVLALVIGGLFGGLTSAGASAGGSFDGSGGDLNVAAFLVVAVAQLAVSFGYFGYCWVMLRATPGMKLLSLQVGDQADGRPVAWDQALLRWFLLGIPAALVTFAIVVPSLLGLVLGIIGFLWLVGLLYTMARSTAVQGLHDRRARTIVVRAARRGA